MNIRKVLEEFGERILVLLYPKVCCFCGKVEEKEVCEICKKQLVYITEPRCKKCGRPVRFEEQEYCYECQKQLFQKDGFSFEQGKNIWLHKNPVNQSIYAFKYHNRRIYGRFYAKEMYRLYQKDIKAWNIDVIIPVPLHRSRKRKRGYNQAEIIAKYLGKWMNLPVDTKTIKRIKKTIPQKQLNDKERRKNLKDAFEIREKICTYKNILLIDDIYTTGSTLDSIAKIIKEKTETKVQCKVWFLTISIGQDF